MFERMEELFTEEEFCKIQNAKVLLVGLGGVGSYAFEALIRSGFREVTVIDSDVYEKNNMNRQLYATTKTLGQLKTEVAKQRAREIDETIKIKAYSIFLNKETYKEIENNTFDYILDACDSVEAKVLLAHLAEKQQALLVSSLGMGNRIDPQKIKITELSKTHDDGLAKALRTRYKKENLPLSTKVLWSEEKPFKSPKKTLCSFTTVPSTAGILLVQTIIFDILKNRLKH